MLFFHQEGGFGNVIFLCLSSTNDSEIESVIVYKSFVQNRAVQGLRWPNLNEMQVRINDFFYCNLPVLAMHLVVLED
jgi:hypothetical protein